ncbi:polysaccharide deacetylase family protein [Sediminibacterium roseum]|uniref:Polysaccharide deacetylase family protein n=1 Tax=Sediminibacterium roseum TaxID=1978412 RepID=A0ABW9ZR69_9BACT|nr:polysaccharide deacetylase family protein [Sediminibacterium roseum]NCI49593.1 polysaccharide deacetylase family protein [Sediminibacterium roseum]
MNFTKLFTRTGFGVLFLVAVAACNNNKADKKAGDSTVAAAPAGAATPGTPIKYDSSKRYIYLTWDDSPQPPGTVMSKNVFREEGIKATFFSVGFNQVGPQKKRLIDSLRNGYPQFLLANHSFSHGFRDQYSKFYSPAMTDSAFNDFMRNEKDLKIPVKIIRLPGNNTWASNGQIDGQKSENALVKKLDAAGYKIIGWDLEWHQAAKAKAPKESVDEMLKMIEQRFQDEYTYQPNSIVILSHDRLFEKKEHADSLRKFISELKKDPRNVFETIDHYPTVQKK